MEGDFQGLRNEMELTTRRISVSDFESVYEFCYEHLRSLKPRQKAEAEFVTLVGSTRLISTVVVEERVGTERVVSAIVGAFLAPGQLNKICSRRWPDVQAYFARQLRIGSVTGRLPFADSSRIGYNNAREGNDLVILYLGFTSDATEDERREIEMQTFQRFTDEWSGYHIATVCGEVWSADQNTAANDLLFQPFNEYEQWHGRCGHPKGSVPQLRGTDRKGAKRLSALNVFTKLFRYERPVYVLQPAVKEGLRFALKMPPYRDGVSRERLNRILAESVYPQVRGEGPLATKLVSRSDTVHGTDEAMRRIVLEFFQEHPWELRPFGNEKDPSERAQKGLGIRLPSRRKLN